MPSGLTNTDHLSNIEAALECKHDALITLELPLTSVCVRGRGLMGGIMVGCCTCHPPSGAVYLQNNWSVSCPSFSPMWRVVHSIISGKLRF